MTPDIKAHPAGDWEPPCLTSVPDDATHIVTGYAVKGPLLTTWHRGESSMQMERSVWLERIARPGDRAVKVVIINRQTHEVETLP